MLVLGCLLVSMVVALVSVWGLLSALHEVRKRDFELSNPEDASRAEPCSTVEMRGRLATTGVARSTVRSACSMNALCDGGAGSDVESEEDDSQSVEYAAPQLTTGFGWASSGRLPTVGNVPVSIAMFFNACAHCEMPIRSDGAVHMRDDRCYCSSKCRTRALSCHYPGCTKSS